MTNRGQYLELCAENYAKNVNARQSLELIKKILETWPKKARKKPIEQLARKNRLLTVFFDDLVGYKKEEAVKADEEGKDKKKSKKGHDARLSHMDHIKTRLDFLQFFLSYGGLQLSVEQVDILWDSFVEKMANMDCRVVTRAGFNLFQRYFLAINEKKDKLKRVPGTHDMYVVTTDIVGGDNLWAIALDANDNDVSRMAITLLNDLHQNVSPESLKPRLGKVREGYVSACMAFLAQEVRKIGREGPNQMSERRVERCIALLKNLVEEFDARAQARVAACLCHS
eukprot:TRINITY_DN560_c0_g1_i26.p1 TRINITY_DN560_c0_g1~~TRINITY_DN560_c0_g1_i26.p1  ORF type:complete len:283 (+),score=55.39 TRINITY_DN560_c0_g1_i26:465-1313(+)